MRRAGFMPRAITSGLVLTLAFSQGCALLLRGKTDTIDVAGSQLEVDGKPTADGPVELRRRQVHVVSAVVNGKRQTRTVESDLSTGWFVIDFVVFGIFLCPIGSIMFIVDLATGSLNEFDDHEVSFPKSDKSTPPTGTPAKPENPGAGAEEFPAPRTGLCSHCGTAFPEHAKFCMECGAAR